jgi:cytochrome c
MIARVGTVMALAITIAAGGASAQSADAGRGEQTFNQQCKICHTVEKGGANKIGPNLFGIFGRKAGTAQGFAASEAMTKSGIVWDDKTLGEYLKDPKGRVPNGKMVFMGLKKPDQLDDVIAYLKKATQ